MGQQDHSKAAALGRCHTPSCLPLLAPTGSSWHSGQPTALRPHVLHSLTHSQPRSALMPILLHKQKQMGTSLGGSKPKLPLQPSCKLPGRTDQKGGEGWWGSKPAAGSQVAAAGKALWPPEAC